MGKNFSIKLDTSRLKALPAIVRDNGEQVLKRGSHRIEARAKVEAPVDTGFLRNSIGSEQLEKLLFAIIVGAEYGAFVEFLHKSYLLAAVKAEKKAIIAEWNKLFDGV